MKEIMKDGVELSIPDKDKSTDLAKERCAAFLAEMILKYGPEAVRESDMTQKQEKS